MTSANGETLIGRAAFIDDDGSPHTPGWLASTIAHERNIHIGQLYAVNPVDSGNNWANKGGGYHVNEIQAYDFEIRNASRFGISETELQTVIGRRNAAYDLIAIYPFYTARISSTAGSTGNNYWILPGDR
jgi:hypothetical protein